uniref:BTB domain-containing protein n=1 Tax=Glossina brevipalpis TaxID=37001 RepID=A0A1A9WLT5_9MUSC
MSVQQFCLRWNNHQPNFIAVCSSLLLNGTLVDVTLAAEGRQLQAHKIVLSACSSYFQTLFTTNPCQHPIVILKDVQYDDLKTMVDFMYYGSGERVNSEDQHNPSLDTATAGGLTLSQMSQMSFAGNAGNSALGGLAAHSLHTAKLLKEASNNDMETHPQDSDSLDDAHGHVHMQIKPEVDISGVQQSIPLDISGTTTPSEHDTPNTQSAHSGNASVCYVKNGNAKKTNSEQDRARIIEAANFDKNGMDVVFILGIAYAIAYRWIREDRDNYIKRGGKKLKIISDQVIEEMLEWLERDPKLSFKTKFKKEAFKTNISNHLHCELYTLNILCPPKNPINNLNSKRERAQYVNDLNDHIENDKQIIWLRLTNFNIFCCRMRGDSALRSLNVYIIAVNNSNTLGWDTRRDSYSAYI